MRPYCCAWTFSSLFARHGSDDYSRGGGGGGNGGGGGMAMHQQQQSPRDDIMIMVPNSAVGALIGAGGSHIKQIIRDSNAYVTVRCLFD